MAGTIYLNPTKKQKKKKDYVAAGENTKMTRTKKEKKKKKRRKRIEERDAEKNITQPKETIQLNEPQEKKEGLQAPNEEGVIDLTQQGQREDEEFTTGDKLKALGTGAVIGGALGFGAVAIGAGGIGAAASLLFGRTTQAAATKLLTHTPTPGATITVNGVKSSISNIANTAVRNGRWSSVANNAKNFLLKKHIYKISSNYKRPKTTFSNTRVGFIHLFILGAE